MLTNVDTSKLVMPGLVPGIHQSSQDAFFGSGWIAGSSPAMTWIDRSILDAQPEPVIGLAEGETRWRGMTMSVRRAVNVIANPLNDDGSAMFSSLAGTASRRIAAEIAACQRPWPDALRSHFCRHAERMVNLQALFVRSAQRRLQTAPGRIRRPLPQR